MKDDDPRKKYWNEKYVNYWRERVAEAGSGNSEIINGDARTSSDEVWTNLINGTKFQNGNILDVGCGWGRFFQMYIEKDLTVYGVDISTEMIIASSKKWYNHDKVKNIQEATAEGLPFEKEMFNNLICIGTFDATFQEKAINEFLRVTKPRGLIYFSGKNTKYHSNDKAALAAEVGARRKGHPNYFTRTNDLLSDLEKHGHKVVKSYYFERRGDLAAMNFKNSMPEYFYEYFIVIKCGKNVGTIGSHYDEHSETFDIIQHAKINSRNIT